MSNKNSSTALEVSNKKKTFSELVHAEEGSGFIEKLIIIGLFIFVVSAGIGYVGDKAHDRLTEQGDSIEEVNTTLGTTNAPPETP